MARIAAFIPDLLFGSRVLEAARAAGHDARLVGDPALAAGAELLIVDLTAEVQQRLERVQTALPSGVRTLAFYSHVEADVRRAALQAGIGLVVPRSRMARDAAALIERALAAP